MRQIDKKAYFLAFLITAIIFGLGIFLNIFFNEKRSDSVRSIGDRITVDILSSETQFDLLTEASCRNLSKNILSTELSELGNRLSFMESELGTNNDEVVHLKRYYSLLQLKDYLLSKRIEEKCGQRPVSIIYFYTNARECEECQRQGFVLTYLREQYPDVRVYSFDYDLDLSALETLKSIYSINANRLPALIMHDDVYYGFRSVEELEDVMPELRTLRATTTEATSTGATSTIDNR
jgi:hypothetical protein